MYPYCLETRFLMFLHPLIHEKSRKKPLCGRLVNFFPQICSHNQCFSTLVFVLNLLLHPILSPLPFAKKILAPKNRYQIPNMGFFLPKQHSGTRRRHSVRSEIGHFHLFWRVIMHQNISKLLLNSFYDVLQSLLYITFRNRTLRGLFGK